MVLLMAMSEGGTKRGSEIDKQRAEEHSVHAQNAPPPIRSLHPLLTYH